MDLTAKVSSAILLLILCLSLASPLITSRAPDAIDLDAIKQPPSLRYPLGTDSLGRDILARVLYGGKISIGISLLAVSVSMGLGLLVGILAGYRGGIVDTVLMAAVDLILAFPALLLAIGISVLFPPGVHTVVIAISAIGWAPFARVVRSSVLSLRTSAFVEAATVIGCTRRRVLFVHILPHCLPLALVMMGLKMGGYILTESALSFLGLGVQPPTATWGAMISANRAFINSAPWMVMSPGIMIAVTAVCFNLLGDGLKKRYGRGSGADSSA